MSSEVPPDLKYIKEHQWAKLEDENIRIGITDYAQKELKEIVMVDLFVAVGDTITAQANPFGSIESAKAVSDVFSPLSGEVVEINSDVQDEPGIINQDPYGKGWLILVKPSDLSELDSLMDADAYQEFIAK